MVCEFRTADEKFSHVPDLTSKVNDGMQAFASLATLHFGVRPANTDQLTQTCIDYLEIIGSHKKTRIGSSEITRKILDAARRFQETSRFADQASISPHCRNSLRANYKERITCYEKQLKSAKSIF